MPHSSRMNGLERKNNTYFRFRYLWFGLVTIQFNLVVYLFYQNESEKEMH